MGFLCNLNKDKEPKKKKKTKDRGGIMIDKERHSIGGMRIQEARR